VPLYESMGVLGGPAALALGLLAGWVVLGLWRAQQVRNRPAMIHAT
jgi:hypothetical protein